MEQQTPSLHHLFEKAGDYIETRVELMKLQAVDKASEVGSSLISGIIIIMVAGIMFFILNIGVAIWLGNELGEVYYGFFVLGAFYLVVVIALYAFRSTWLKKPMLDILVKKMLN